MSQTLIKIILGPTAIGKSKYALELASKINGEIISADSMQVYRYMDIGTAKPTEEERRRIVHHLIDVVEPDENFTVVDWLQLSAAVIPDIFNRGKNPLIVGGTGFYFKALFEGLSPPIVTDSATREKVKKEIEVLGKEKIFEKLKKIDPVTAERLHPNDIKRISRALEVYYLTGKPFSSQQKKNKLPYEFETTCLNCPREELYKKIENRVELMIKRGLIEEVKNLLDRGYQKNLQSMQALGYKETIDYLEGCYSFEEYVNLLKKKTRNFAKRQLTWFRSFKNVNWLEVK